MQYVYWVSGVLQGDLGGSFTTGQPVAKDLLQRLPASAELTICAFALAISVALPLGVAAALKPRSLLDHACRALATAGVSLPTFVTGLMLIWLFYAYAGIAPEPSDTGMP
jgi:peptide/nickel transport system permease protein